MPVRKAPASAVMTLTGTVRGRLTDLLRTIPACLLAGALVSGCSVINTLPVFQQPEPPVPPQARKTPPAPEKLPRITILLSEDVPAYTGIADELQARLPEKPVIINLHGEHVKGADLPGKPDRSGAVPVIAIGPQAAQAASEYTTGRIVFCQVFNYRDLGLTDARMQGVNMLPPAELQFRAWKHLDPGLSRVGVITGQGHDTLIAQAREAAQGLGIELEHRVVRSDKEMLYAFKRMTPDIQGLWLLPDDRVLSRRVLREIMAYSAKHERQVVVFHPALLRLGALMSVSSVDSDIAAQVISALRSTPKRGTAPQTGLLPLSKIHVDINPARAYAPATQSALEPGGTADAR